MQELVVGFVRGDRRPLPKADLPEVRFGRKAAIAKFR
jgi:hypothetical protein